MIFCLPDAFPKELITEIRETMPNIQPPKRHNFGCLYNRVGRTIDLGLPELKELDTKISMFMSDFSSQFIQPNFAPAYPSSDSGYEYHKYGIGDSCLAHADQEFTFFGGAKNSLLRFATVIAHLNTVEEGGETIFPNQNKKFKTVEGQILVFPPHGGYLHYVTPCVDTEREILMTWFVYNGINVIKV
jgi:hypothetical protein